MSLTDSFISINKLDIFNDYTDILRETPSASDDKKDTTIDKQKALEIVCSDLEKNQEKIIQITDTLTSAQNSVSSQYETIFNFQTMIMNTLQALRDTLLKQTERIEKLEAMAVDIKETLNIINGRLVKNDTVGMYNEIRKYSTKQRTETPLGFVKMQNY